MDRYLIDAVCTVRCDGDGWEFCPGHHRFFIDANGPLEAEDKAFHAPQAQCPHGQMHVHKVTYLGPSEEFEPFNTATWTEPVKSPIGDRRWRLLLKKRKQEY